MTSLCLIHDGAFVYCLNINALTVAVFFATGVFLNIGSNLIAERIRGRRD